LKLTEGGREGNSKWLEDVENDLLEPKVKRLTQKVNNTGKCGICRKGSEGP
jgi:hypothetical protein